MMLRLSTAIIAAWIASTSAATAALWAKSGIVALELLPVFAVLLGLWLLCTGAIAAVAHRRKLFMVGWMYGASVASAFFAVVLFFVLFAYPLMVCVPLGMLVAAPTFHAVIHAWPTVANAHNRNHDAN